MNMTADQLRHLYWLGYVLTGDQERSVRAAIETLEMPDAANQFFEEWMVTWSRKIFIAKVLRNVAPATSAPQLGARLRSLQSGAWRSLKWRIEPPLGKPELERVLLAIDWLPRCALILSLFEKLAIEDIAILLNVDRESVKTATAIGLIEAARNLAGEHKSPLTRPAIGASLCAMEEITA